MNGPHCVLHICVCIHVCMCITKCLFVVLSDLPNAVNLLAKLTCDLRVMTGNTMAKVSALGISTHTHTYTYIHIYKVTYIWVAAHARQTGCRICEKSIEPGCARGAQSTLCQNIPRVVIRSATRQEKRAHSECNLLL